ncbi:E1-E2 ATPase-domain-containing protein [Penicillium chrysogenum]|nr:E1-E2 ATPase-domain-containing protein [Penicillium chrysogenum]
MLPTSPDLAEHDSRSLRSTFFISNVHCSSCAAVIREILLDIPGVNDIIVSVFTHEARVVHTAETGPSNLAMALIQAAFEVHHVTTYNSEGIIMSDVDTSSWLPRDSVLFSSQPSSYTDFVSHRRHIDNCALCMKEEPEGLSTAPGLSGAMSYRTNTRSRGRQFVGNSISGMKKLLASVSVATAESCPTTDETPCLQPKKDEGLFSARMSIGAMSCASCVNSITNEIKQFDFVHDVTVNLLTNSAILVYAGPRENIETVVGRVEDIGFDPSLSEVKPVHTASPSERIQTYIADIDIGGMTCGTCSGSITRGLQELPFMKNVSVNLLAHNGRVEFEGHDHLAAIIGKLEHLGYDASVGNIRPRITADDNDARGTRVLAVRVDGMFCQHCPENVLNTLKGLSGVEVDNTLSVNNPILRITYTPRAPSFTVRDILRSVEKSHNGLTATVYQPPSIEDRSRAIQRHEMRRLLSRLLFLLIIVIPTFLIGIVFMSLVSPDNNIRKHLEQSLWAGDVSRIEWALFIMSTPVMFYGADLFHVRAVKEVYSLWRPGSRIPILRRFYRFGSMNLLVSAGTTVAYVSSLAVLIMDAVARTSSNTHSSNYFDSVVFLTFFLIIGRFIEAYSKEKTGDAVASLGKLRPSDALLVTDDQPELGNNTGDDGIRRINIDLLEIGDMVSIPYGASPPADGIVIGTGSYQFDESSLTGEARPVHKTTGDQIYTGSVNVGQPIKIRVSSVGSLSMLDQIISVVREGQGRQAPLERIADLLISHFVPVITLIAILTFVIWLTLGLSGALPMDYLDNVRGGWTFWSLEFAISVFVVACPCGLALAAPTALFVGGGLAARHGILVKGGGEAFQEASRLDAIVFDKTGTLTEGGSLKVSDHTPLIPDSLQLQVAWALARKLEESSNHPIARAILQFCGQGAGISISESNIEEKSGQGMKGSFIVSIEDFTDKPKTTVRYEAAIGSHRLLESLVSSEHNDSNLSNVLSVYQAAGKSTAILSLREISTDSPGRSSFTPALVFAISDTIRPEAIQVISALQKREIAVFMCTGDNQTTAHAVADMVGIARPNVVANIMPAGKADFAESQDSERGTRSIVAFVGDGVNDSPALAAADVSIAMASGSDVAMNSADFILLNSELTTILNLVVLSRRVFNRVRMNFGWAVVYNLCLVPVAAGVFYPMVSGHEERMIGDKLVMINTHWRLSPVWAALAMALSSISVICSSLALGVDRNAVKKVLGLA